MTKKIITSDDLMGEGPPPNHPNFNGDIKIPTEGLKRGLQDIIPKNIVIELKEKGIDPFDATIDLNKKYETDYLTASQKIVDGDCTDCGGAGAFKDKDGNLFPCSNPIHGIERQKAMQKVVQKAGLEDTKIFKLDQLEEYHDVNEVITIPGVTKLNSNGKHELKEFPSSNKNFLKIFKKLSNEPFIKGRTLLQVVGTYGNGKTHASKALVGGLVQSGRIDARYITLYELIDLLKAGFKNSSSQKIFDEIIRKTPFLIIDEFDFHEQKIQKTDYTETTATRIIDCRWELSHKAVTIIVSNYPATLTLPTAYHLHDRLNDFYPIYVTAPSRRGIKLRNED